MINLADFRIKIFADGANLSDMTTLYKNPMIKGFTTNPSLMRKEGIEDYEEFGPGGNQDRILAGQEKHNQRMSDQVIQTQVESKSEGSIERLKEADRLYKEK